MPQGAKLDRICQSSAPTSRPRTRSFFFSSPKSTRRTGSLWCSISISLELTWHFLLRYREYRPIRPCPLGFFTFWCSVSSLESVFARGLFSSSSTWSTVLFLFFFFFFFFFFEVVVRASELPVSATGYVRVHVGLRHQRRAPGSRRPLLWSIGVMLVSCTSKKDKQNYISENFSFFSQRDAFQNYIFSFFRWEVVL